MKKYILIAMMIFYSATNFGQDKQKLRIIYTFSDHTSFPDTGRINGHSYDNVFYDAKSHYQDNKVMIAVPGGLDKNKSIDIVCWFHGWRNNIDSASVRYDLLKQFEASNRNAILILPETARDAPDSYGGRLENNGEFKKLITDVLSALKQKKLISFRARPGRIILAGHSGAYRVIAYILQNGGMAVNETILFDALYGETDKFMTWMKWSKENVLVNIFTNNGGTLNETYNLVRLLEKENIRYDSIPENNLFHDTNLMENILIVHSGRQHNDIINSPDIFQLLLTKSPFLKMIK